MIHDHHFSSNPLASGVLPFRGARILGMLKRVEREF
jgi:hypothetical protein